MQRTGHWLMAVLATDGAGVAGLCGAAIALARPSMGTMAIAAAGGWVLALAGVPDAARHRTPSRIRVARIRVVAGMLLTSGGALWVGISFPGVAVHATALLVAGLAVSAAYLLLLRRLRTDA